MSNSKFESVDSLTLEQLKDEVVKYRRGWATRGQKLQLYKEVINDLTDKPVDSFITKDGKSAFVKNDEAILEFKRGGDGAILVRKANASIIEYKNQITELTQTCNHLQIELEKTIYNSGNQIKNLHEEIKKFKENDTLERYRELIKTLFSKRRALPVKDIKIANDNQEDIFSLFWNNNIGSSEAEERERIFSEQKEVEFGIVEGCLEMLRSVFDELPTGTKRLDKASIKIDIEPILNVLSEARNRLSFVMNEKAFESFLRDHISEVNEILDLFNSRARDPRLGETPVADIIISLSSHEKGLINYNPKSHPAESYLKCYEKGIDIQRRLLVSYRPSQKLEIFDGIKEFSYNLVFAQLEDVIRIILITNNPVNNIVYIPIPHDPESIHWSFYIFKGIEKEKRYWELDSHLLYICQIFKDQYLNLAQRIFRAFYRDVMGHNEYRRGFEEQMKENNIERWKQIQILYENIQIVSDEFMFPELVRHVIRTHASYYTNKTVDILNGNKKILDIEWDKIRKRWNSGLPPSDGQSEDWIQSLFEKIKEFRPSDNDARYFQRWKDFLIQHYVIKK